MPHDKHNQPVSPATTTPEPLQLRIVGRVVSTLIDRTNAPRQPDEGAPSAWLEFDEAFAQALEGLDVGAEIFVLTWLDKADREVLRVHPRGDPARALAGVFATRAPDRPNPIGLHRVTIASIEGLRIRVRALEAIHGTPIVDVKPLLREDVATR